MTTRPSSVSTAFWTYVLPITTARAMRIGVVLVVLFILSAIGLFMSGLLSEEFREHSLTALRHFLVMVGVPVGAVLLSEIPIRDGITHRTLLYPLLGPVSRTTLALVRFAVTGLVLAAGASVLLVLIRLLLGEGLGFLPRELLSVSLGSFAYVALFGLMHLYNRRGLIVGLVVFLLFDLPLGRVPFSLRNLSPSYHVGVVANQQESMQLPISFGMPETSVTISALILLSMAVILTAAIAVGFKRKDLGDIC
jgi:hypothetical protein